MRVPMVAGNWKMNTSVSEAVGLVNSMMGEVEKISGVRKVVCPPFISLVPVRALIRESSLELGAQNMYFEEKGAFTGEISPTMLSDLCQYVILGHSERRHYFGETDKLITQKARASVKFGLVPILCVGETLEQKELGKTRETVARQVRAVLQGMSPSSSLVIAYEPVWAIGTGRAATATEANSTIEFIRNVVAELWGDNVAGEVSILYGGSTNPENISDFIAQSDIDGALVGGASLKSREFVSIIRQTAQAKA